MRTQRFCPNGVLLKDFFISYRTEMATTLYFMLSLEYQDLYHSGILTKGNFLAIFEFVVEADNIPAQHRPSNLGAKRESPGCGKSLI
jgi:uncharacterized protein YqgQ